MQRQARAAAMSWQSYVDDHLMYPLPTGHSLVAAAIIGHDGSVWAQSEMFPQVRPFGGRGGAICGWCGDGTIERD